MKQFIKKHHKIGAAIMAAAVVLFAISFAVPSLSSYFIISGIALLLVGLFIFSPSSWTF